MSENRGTPGQQEPDDERRTEPALETEGIELGTDWLMSQLESNETGQFTALGFTTIDGASGENDPGRNRAADLGNDSAGADASDVDVPGADASDMGTPDDNASGAGGAADDDANDAPRAGGGAPSGSRADDDAALAHPPAGDNVPMPSRTRQTFIPPSESADVSAALGLDEPVGGGQPGGSGAEDASEEHAPLPPDETLSIPIVGEHGPVAPPGVPSAPRPASLPSAPEPELPDLLPRQEPVVSQPPGAGAEEPEPEPEPELSPWWRRAKEPEQPVEPAPEPTDDSNTGHRADSDTDHVRPADGQPAPPTESDADGGPLENAAFTPHREPETFAGAIPIIPGPMPPSSAEEQPEAQAASHGDQSGEGEQADAAEPAADEPMAQEAATREPETPQMFRTPAAAPPAAPSREDTAAEPVESQPSALPEPDRAPEPSTAGDDATVAIPVVDADAQEDADVQPERAPEQDAGAQEDLRGPTAVEGPLDAEPRTGSAQEPADATRAIDVPGQVNGAAATPLTPQAPASDGWGDEPDEAARPGAADGVTASSTLETGKQFIWGLAPNDEPDPLIVDQTEAQTEATAAPAEFPASAEPEQPAEAVAIPASPQPAESAETDEPLDETVAMPIAIDESEPAATPDAEEEASAAPVETDPNLFDDSDWLLSDEHDQVSEATQLMPTVEPGRDDRGVVPDAATVAASEPASAGAPAQSPSERQPAPISRSNASDSTAETRLLDMGGAAAVPAAASGARADEPSVVPNEKQSRPRPPRALLVVAAAIVAALVLVALFFLGTRLPSLFAAPLPTPTVTVTPTVSAAPEPADSAQAAGPVAPGDHPWDALAGGECLEPYSTPWAEEFTVVDCATPHAAQMIFAAPVDPSPEAVYPGEAAIAAQISLWCSAPDRIDLQAAGAYTDVQVQGTYPATEAQWDEGERTYYCFVSRSSGEPITGSLAAPPADA